VDPSHAAGKWGLVAPLAKAGIAVGADGLIVEVHTAPEEAVSDGVQSLLPSNFAILMYELVALAKASGREL
jgi:3-deoxy-7-phosphoheptulonate synthase